MDNERDNFVKNCAWLLNGREIPSTERDKLIMDMRDNGATFREIAEILKLSRTRARQIFKRITITASE